MTAPVTVLGSANLDLVVRAARLPGPGETIFGSSFTTVPGGKGLNQAVAAQRAGGSVRFIGAVGTDSFGTELREFLTAEGLDLAALETVPGSTGTAHITVQDSGENSIIVVPGANGEVVSLSDAGRRAIDGAAALVMQFELPQSVLFEGASYARERGIRTVLTPAPVVPVIDGLLELVDILVPNQHEVTLLAGIDDVEEATLALSDERIVVATLGTDGCLVAENGEIVARVPARQVEAIDTTAAGDTFVGTFVTRLVSGDALEVALQWATIASSISVTRPGAASSMPRWDEIHAAQ